ncbi:hypothetical protein [Flaviaesturariibacter aridisoli]|uniref:hypothetical protein n=1 Tax=Flaviaesturariibacter aridisoli TaxID=2545761 RepID=UPI0014043ADB|nr:hypothetical protein [Flaviaesturariibacter aridisoli]
MNELDPIPDEHDDDPRRRERNPVLTLFLILVVLFALGILLLVFRPGILDTIFGNN